TGSNINGIITDAYSGLLVYHNTFHLDGNNSAITRGLYQNGAATNLEFKNNIYVISNIGAGAKDFLYFNTATAVQCDNNVFHMASTTGTINYIYYSGATYSNLAQWQASNSGMFDQNSVDLDPIFLDALNGDFTPTNNLTLGIGANLLSTVPFDIFGNPRKGNPDPGAIQVIPLSNRDIQVNTILSPTTPITAGFQSVEV